jgi:hypothetical protein
MDKKTQQKIPFSKREKNFQAENRPLTLRETSFLENDERPGKLFA